MSYPHPYPAYTAEFINYLSTAYAPGTKFVDMKGKEDTVSTLFVWHIDSTDCVSIMGTSGHMRRIYGHDGWAHQIIR
jgi:hypothetical protein